MILDCSDCNIKLDIINAINVNIDDNNFMIHVMEEHNNNIDNKSELNIRGIYDTKSLNNWYIILSESNLIILNELQGMIRGSISLSVNDVINNNHMGYMKHNIEVLNSNSVMILLSKSTTNW